MIPTTVKIGGYTVTVRYAPHTMTDEGICGAYNSRIKEIVLDPDLGDETMHGVFIHEVVEAIKDIYHTECLRDDHHAINQLGESLHQVLRDNPEIVPK